MGVCVKKRNSFPLMQKICPLGIILEGGRKMRNALKREPNHQRWPAKWKLSWNTYALHTHFCMFGADLHAQSALVNKISASELSRKFVKSALLVGEKDLDSPHKKEKSFKPHLSPFQDVLPLPPLF